MVEQVMYCTRVQAKAELEAEMEPRFCSPAMPKGRKLCLSQTGHFPQTDTKVPSRLATTLIISQDTLLSLSREQGKRPDMAKESNCPWNLLQGWKDGES